MTWYSHDNLGDIHQFSEKREAGTVDFKERDADLLDSCSVSPTLTSGSEALWELKGEAVVTKPVAVCLKV